MNSLTAYGLPPIEDMLWPAIFKLAHRPWFARLWVMQEVILARRLVFLCGEYLVDFEDGIKFLKYLDHLPLRNDISQVHNFSALNTTDDNALDTLSVVSMLRGRNQRGGSSALASLALARRKLAREPVDKVYGILGIIGSDIRDKIRVDYSPESKRDFWKLYVDVCRTLLEDDGYRILRLTSSEQRHPELPTWCPDFRYQSPSVEMSLDFFTAGVGTEGTDVSRIPMPIVKRVGTVGVGFCGLRMDTTKAFEDLYHAGIMDAGAEYGPDMEEQDIQCEPRCLKLSQEAYGTRTGEVPPQHIKTLVRCMHFDGTPYNEAEVTADYHRWREWYPIMAAASSDNPPILDQKTRTASDRYNYAALTAWKGTGFFSTKVGSIGIGPQTLQCNDSIHMFFGSPKPCILRFDPRRQGYKFVGLAFVFDFMTGQAFYAKDPLNTYEWFTVV
ncbi:Fc.00g045160.m01.CDS01 [Cosmosporella sp. VM-42]